ncbi:MAG: murein biosynthesis integral membrane protein MurJ [Sulfurimonas sp. RIFOXYD12_FULL_33_39]|uniref:murein biosynthesis integral membrane protein MurJ n=1 Tax=unclassified Sulfurimonas TaxID=2623549 RepID=UPI0008BAB2B5|nr:MULTISPECIES: murein biosynthesis integral membrane protein MurJ [unclassified Sulfurimonas]OHE09489.1 MAG: murein biosynthesis integral membrane protein MurJ [Sulfurimonas sp. RIFOXYD12_FULL_33_39]OHE12730.1 MAG: murein biosynthesis integral membrane protein MurJ [Sulfurimonas sp. RIFOXYD2_FULL_34_21]DAB28582.1 MAG TPA: murein biosynthesis integral membrane protein MurJ [Sulfurimonas sp. UBA10385]
MFKAIFTNSFGILFSRVLGFFRDLLTASALGANIYSDIFFVAFKLPNLFRRIFAEGAFTQVFIPAYAHSKHKSVFSANIFFIFLSIIIIITLLVNILPSLAAQAIAVGFDEKTIELASPFIAINFWYLPLIFAVTFLSTMLQYKRHFATTAFSTALLNISLIAALYLSSDKSQNEIVYYLSFGVVIGGILQLIVHVLAIHRLGLLKPLYGGFKYLRVKSVVIKHETAKFKKQFFPAIWGNSTPQVSAFLDTFLASFLATGSISYLYYGNRIFQLPLAIFAIATSIALFPSIARYMKNQDIDKARVYMERAFWFLTFLLTASTIGGYMLAHEIIWILFERGSFTAQDTINTASVLKMYMIGLLPLGLQKLFLLWLYANEQQLRAAKIATYSLTFYIVSALVLITPMGAAGLALAGTISGFIGFILTVKEFGVKEFFNMLVSKKTIYLVVGSILLTVLLAILKDFIIQYIS